MIPLRGILDHFDINLNQARFKLPGKHQKKEVDRFSPTERELILDQLSGDPQIFYALMFGTGMRPSEILALTWQDYDGQQMNVCKGIVRRKLKPNTKTHECRIVYIPSWVRPYI
jgi:integrase